MANHIFRLVNADIEGSLENTDLLRPKSSQGAGDSFINDARLFVSGKPLETAINTAIAVNEPLLVTGEPGTGKTQAAYYAAYKLGIEPVIHFQVKSDSTARDLLYHFDAVRYFHDAHLQSGKHKSLKLNKANYIEKRPLWEALIAEQPKILLIDEIDKAPRDFPNDLLHELDKLEFTVLETGKKITAGEKSRPIIFITSNSERRLPEPFLRRCVYHHIPFERELVWKAVQKRKAEYKGLSDEFLKMAVERFMTLREQALRKRPATGELLVWLRILGLNVGEYSEDWDKQLSELPFLSVLIKDHQDLEGLEKSN